MFKSLEPVENPSFQVAWESTLKCNMDCSYCGDGHNNKLSHPSLEDSLKTVDFIFEYLQIQMDRKPTHLRTAGINIQGGESVFHPNIIKILEYIHEKKKSIDYTLTVALITNAVAGLKKWQEVVKLVDYFTISYHAEMTTKQELMFRHNLISLKFEQKKFQVNIMMHPKYWEKCMLIIDFCKKHKFKNAQRQIDHHWFDTRFNYNADQVEYITGSKPVGLKDKLTSLVTNGFNLDAKGRSCCGGNSLCADGCNVNRVVNKFHGWHCSVDKYFLYIRQTTGEIFTNKDCRMNWDGKTGPIGNLKNTQLIIDRLLLGTPTIICQKSKCWCGLCAPKAETAELYETISRKYAKEVNLMSKDQ